MRKIHNSVKALFMFSLIFLVASTYKGQDNIDMSNHCHHCDTISACEDGGQAYGWTNCEYFPEHPVPYNCRVYGSSECGTEPGEG